MLDTSHIASSSNAHLQELKVIRAQYPPNTARRCSSEWEMSADQNSTVPPAPTCALQLLRFCNQASWGCCTHSPPRPVISTSACPHMRPCSRRP
eukprot:750507-Amphidinium_carterae.2